MVTISADTRREMAAKRAADRSAVYRLLSQLVAYPGGDEIANVRDVDLPQAQAATLTPRVAALVANLAEHLETSGDGTLETHHRRIFSHVISADCPPCETFYTARHVFQETQYLADIGGFFRAFGLDLAGGERLDHISVELEFMHFLTYKEAYALTHHGPAKARICRQAQRTFMRDHLGRWTIPFAQRLGQKAGGGYYGCVASLLEAFVAREMDFLRVGSDDEMVSQEWRGTAPDDFRCPLSEDGS